MNRGLKIIGGFLCFWDTVKSECVAKLTGYTKVVTSVSWHQDPRRKLLASGGGDTTVRVWDTTQAKCLLVQDCKCVITAIAFIGSGEWLGVGGWDNSVRVYRFTGTELILHFHSRPVLDSNAADIADLYGLSSLNAQLLTQRGAIGTPRPPEEAWPFAVAEEIEEEYEGEAVPNPPTHSRNPAIMFSRPSLPEQALALAEFLQQTAAIALSRPVRATYLGASNRTYMFVTACESLSTSVLRELTDRTKLVQATAQFTELYQKYRGILEGCEMRQLRARVAELYSDLREERSGELELDWA